MGYIGMGNGFVTNTELFAIATQMYVRLRRVTGRVVDAMYLAENQQYAQYVMELALASKDAELERYAERLRSLIHVEVEPAAAEAIETAPDLYDTELSQEEIYQAQVSHHYIGALR